MLGIDYAWQHPDPRAVKADGYGFVCRYVSHDPTKNITLTEARGLAEQDVWVVTNWEYNAQDMLRGYAGGVADATLALAQATAAGMPKGRPIYFSADWDVTPAQEAAVTEYLRGAASVLGTEAVGEYAGLYPVKIARDNGTAWTWQTSGWSGGQWDPRDTIRQTGTAVVGGVQVDVNEALTPDFGQWQPGRLPTQSPLQEVTMQDVLLAVADGPDKGGIWLRTSDGQYGHVPDPETRDALVTLLGVPEKTVPDAVHQMFLTMAASPGLILTDAQAQLIAAAIVAKLPAVPTPEQIAGAVTARVGSALSNG